MKFKKNLVLVGMMGSGKSSIGYMVSKKLNINFIDVHQELFEQYSDPKSLFPFGEFGHYSEKGYKKVADIIYSLTKD